MLYNTVYAQNTALKALTAVMLLASVMTSTACSHQENTSSSEDVTTKPAADQQKQAPEIPLSDQSYYLTMRDGVRIALNLYFPESQQPEEPATTLLVQTRYGRATMLRYDRFSRWRKNGYVIASVDTRGSTASFGLRQADIGPDEIRDMDEIIAHLTTQNWSNGKVIAVGASYMADTADIATSRPAPSLVGAVIRQLDFDAYRHLFAPGGIFNDWMFSIWGDRTYDLDLGQSNGLDCKVRVTDCALLFPYLQPVDEDTNYSLLQDALSGRDRWTAQDFDGADFRDDRNKKGFSMFGASPASQLGNIVKEAKPIQIWGSWMDGGTADAAISRYLSAPAVPQEIWITANNHGNTGSFDPFFPNQTNDLLSVMNQPKEVDRFLELLEAGEAPKRQITYYVLGSGITKTSTTWPPADSTEMTFYLSSAEALSPTPSEETDVISYDVDFSAGTGMNTRWSTQAGINPGYRDRQSEDEKLVVFESHLMQEPTELVGTPVIHLNVSAQTHDPAFFVYLEDVAPDGRVTYLTEGMLRAIHRRPADSSSLPNDQGPAPKTFYRKDMLPVVPSEEMTVEFALMPVAALIKKGHKIRIAVAGADTNYFRRHSEGKNERFDIRIGGHKGSFLKVHLKPWKYSPESKESN